MLGTRETDMKIFFTCLALGLLTYGGMWAVDFFSSSATAVCVKETLLAPGAIFSSLFWPEGIHSDAPYSWLVVAMLVNLATFVFVWYCAIFIGRLLESRRSSSST